MIELRRPTALPPTLRANGKGGIAAADHERCRANDSTFVPKEIEPHWGSSDVHGALLAMQGWVCAYCQRTLDPRVPKHVDHFRPKKGGYWWLAFAFDNYFLACPLCNTRKGERFPLHEGATRMVYETRERRAEEERLLLDPTADPLDQWMRIEMDGEGGAQGLIAAPMPALRAQHTIEFFALNDDVDHLQERVRLLEELTTMLREGKREELRRRASRYRPHALTVRSFLAAYDPELLPDPLLELRWFVSYLCERLKSLLDERRQQSASIARRAREVQWALAVVWNEPPAGTREDVAQWLEEAGYKQRIERYYLNQLR